MITLFLFNALSLVRAVPYVFIQSLFLICWICWVEHVSVLNSCDVRLHLVDVDLSYRGWSIVWDRLDRWALGVTGFRAQDAEIPPVALPTTFVSDADSAKASVVSVVSVVHDGLSLRNVVPPFLQHPVFHLTESNWACNFLQSDVENCNNDKTHWCFAGSWTTKEKTCSATYHSSCSHLRHGVFLWSLALKTWMWCVRCAECPVRWVQHQVLLV